MTRHVLLRLAWAIPQLFLVVALAFLVIHLLPGDPARAVFGSGGVTADWVASVRERYHLDDSIPVQFQSYISHLVQGDLGYSFTTQQPVAEMIGDVLPYTAVLAAVAIVLGWPLGVAFGRLAARRQGRVPDVCVTAAATFLVSVPAYLMGLFLLYEFSFRLGWLPAAGDRGVVSIILPGLTLALFVMGLTTRVARSALIEAADADHVRVAAAKGLRTGPVWRRHVVRNALIPLTTLGGLTFGELLAGAVFVETIFSRPGVGRLAVQAITQRDYPVLQGIILTVAVMYVLLNLVVDLLYAALDPQFRDSLEVTPP